MKCLIFDFDGVIVDSFDASYKISRAFLDVKNKDELKELMNGSIANVLKNKLSPEKLKSFFKKYTSALSSLPIVPGIAEAIKKLSKEYFLTIVSSTTSGSIKNFLKAHELDNYFTEILGIDSDPSKEVKIKELMSTCGFKTNDCLMITDTVGDIVEATRAGVRTIGVTWGYHDEQTLTSAKPTAIAHTPLELVKLINSKMSS